MFQLGIEAQAGLLITAVILLNLFFRKYAHSGIPRLRVIILCLLCILLWICCSIITLVDTDPNHTMLWGIMTLFSMAATVFIMFIALSEILQSPGY